MLLEISFKYRSEVYKSYLVAKVELLFKMSEKLYESLGEYIYFDEIAKL